MALCGVAGLACVGAGVETVPAGAGAAGVGIVPAGAGAAGAGVLIFPREPSLREKSPSFTSSFSAGAGAAGVGIVPAGAGVGSIVRIVPSLLLTCFLDGSNPGCVGSSGAAGVGIVPAGAGVVPVAW
jgi:hypothetical protein